MRLRRAFVLVSLLAAGGAAFGADGPTKATIDGREVSDIRSVKLLADGRVQIVYGTSGFSTSFEKLPEEFAAAWQITKEASDTAKAAFEIKSKAGRAAELERAIAAGLFREVNGVVYDVRKALPGWTTIKDAKLLQKLPEAALVDVSTDRRQIDPAYVENLPRLEMLTDTERFAFTARQVGTMDYVNKLGMPRSVRAFDCGRPVRKDEIPETILTEGRAFARMETGAAAGRDVLALLPQSDELLGSGTGFFLTADGYFITNDHVVRGANRVKLRHKGKIISAEVIRQDRQADLALLKAEGKFTPLPVAWDKIVNLGQEAFTIGFPNITLQGIEPKYTDGKISSLAGLRDDPGRYQISVPVQPGNSGGPLVDREGNVIGVIVARISDAAALQRSGAIPQNVNYAVKVKLLADFLKPQGNVRTAVKPAGNLAADKAIQSVEDAVAMVLAY